MISLRSPYACRYVVADAGNSLIRSVKLRAGALTSGARRGGRQGDGRTLPLAIAIVTAATLRRLLPR